MLWTDSSMWQGWKVLQCCQRGRNSLPLSFFLPLTRVSRQTVICRTALPYLHVMARREDTQSPLPPPLVHQYSAVVKAERSPTGVQKEQLSKFQVKLNPHSLQPPPVLKHWSLDWLEKSKVLLSNGPETSQACAEPSLIIQATGGRS